MIVPFQVFIGLTLCNVIWSLHPIMGKYLLEVFTPDQTAWLRYSSSFFTYLFLVLGIRISQGKKFNWRDYFLVPSSIQEAILIGLLGGLTFCLSPLLQMSGLSESLATENAVIVAMEPLMTAFLAWMILGERVDRLFLSAFFLALLGFCFLAGWDFRVSGSLLILLSLVGEASYSILGNKLTSRNHPASVFGSGLAFGVLILSLTLCIRFPSSLSEIGANFLAQTFSWRTGIALIWIGPIGTALGYLYYTFALTQASVVSLALFLFLQPLLGAVWGRVFLGDQLTSSQETGCLLILFAVLLPQAKKLKKQAFLGKTT